ncbi:GatB/YqeY domain-containing protein [Bacteroidota bacterium]
MSLTETINEEIKKAMLAREKDKLEALRSVKTAFTLARTEKSGATVLSEDEELKIIQKLVKQRKDSADIYKEQNRNDLYEKEMMEMEVIKVFMPAQMDEAELRIYLESLIKELGASSMQDMGKVMGAASKALAGKADGKVISGIVRDLLG